MSTFVTFQAFPHSILQPLPKRPALEKSCWASSLLSPSFLHYQQFLANTQLQQPTAAFYPTGNLYLCYRFKAQLVIFHFTFVCLPAFIMGLDTFIQMPYTKCCLLTCMSGIPRIKILIILNLKSLTTDLFHSKHFDYQAHTAVTNNIVTILSVCHSNFYWPTCQHCVTFTSRISMLTNYVSVCKVCIFLKTFSLLTKVNIYLCGLLLYQSC